jgi:hypothetical protein
MAEHDLEAITFPKLDGAPALTVGDQSPRGLRRRRRTFRLGQTRCLSRRRGVHGRPACARILERLTYLRIKVSGIPMPGLGG